VRLLAAKFGGYGKTVTCDGGSAMAKSSQQECVNATMLLDCVTAGTTLQCASDTAQCNSANGPACAEYQACYLGDGG
jgi:hypothetical protein